MTDTKENLSTRIAELYGIEAVEYAKNEHGDIDNSCPNWLIDDTARMFELAVENDNETAFFKRGGIACTYYFNNNVVQVKYSDHPIFIDWSLYDNHNT